MKKIFIFILIYALIQCIPFVGIELMQLAIPTWKPDDFFGVFIMMALTSGIPFASLITNEILKSWD